MLYSARIYQSESKLNRRRNKKIVQILFSFNKAAYYIYAVRERRLKELIW